MDPSEPMDWCVPAEECLVEAAGRREAVFEFEADTETGLGTFAYTDDGVRNAGRRFSLTADVTKVEYHGSLPWSFQYHLQGTYQAKGGSAVPTGVFDGWFNWSSYSEAPYVVIYLREGGGSGFSYMNQGQMTSGYLYHPDREPSGPTYDLGTLGPSPAYYGNADAINNRGQVVGDSTAGTEWHMFVWERGEMTDLGVPPGGTEPPRVSWRLQPLRGWSHDTARKISEGRPGTGRPVGL
jgi:probable HAF family extracellular repeat protein